MIHLVGLHISSCDRTTIMLHTHLSGRKMKFRQFRANRELPGLAVDDTYDFEYQQTRPLSTEAKILRGDHLTVGELTANI